ncbi:MAG TPA: FG-GAP-like repeat-containing protein, partial [Chitinophagaceae bacterium]|nr:FG-GAP-like repeat-containing protein [Chitinophagaceae bacterium]
INFASEAPNVNGLGACVELHYNKGQQQVYENTPYRGYLSTVQAGAHFGLGNAMVVDSVIIKWEDGKMQLLKNVFANKVITVQHKDAVMFDTNSIAKKIVPLFTDISSHVAAGIANKDDDFIDFNIQKLLPHKLSDYSPALAAGDINGDGLDDIVMGGSYGYSTQILLQQDDGKFTVQNLVTAASRDTKPSEDMGLLLFDADGDGDNDLYIAAGGYESEANTSHYRDKLYVNDGKGNFIYDSLAVPQNFTSKSCVRAADIDNDGDLDLFVAGRCLPSKYPSPVSCFIYRNDSKNSAIKFTDVTDDVCSGLKNIGMTCDAVFTDFDNDGWADFVMAGEFMPLKFFKNNHGKFQLLPTNIDNENGWWNSIVPGDFDNDGDMDFIAGNVGANSFYRPTAASPIKVYAKDFDNNGSFDAFLSVHLPASQKDKTIKEFPAELRDDAIKQMIEMRNKFKTYNEYANATIDKLFSPEQLKDAITLTANNFKSCFIKNDGNGKFTITPLPLQAQLSSVFGMLAEDVNSDGNLDVVIHGNDFGTEVSIGRYDAMNGLVLLGDGKGNFSALSILQSGIFIPGNGRALVKFADAKGKCLLAASQCD